MSSIPRSLRAATFLIVAASVSPAGGRAQSASPLGGVWTLNRGASEMPQDIGFNPDWFAAGTAPEGQSGGAGGGRGRRGGGSSAGGGRGFAGPGRGRQESYEEARRVQLLTAEARNPPARIVIVDNPATFTITNELGQSRTLHLDGKQESVEIEGVLIPATAMRETDRVVVVYHAGQDRDVRYTYSHTASPPALVVELQFLERGAGDKARRVYEPGVATETAATTTRTASAAPAGGAPAGAPAQEKPDAFDQRPGAELRGIKSLGILVEDLGPQALACGLNRDAIEAALTRKLSDGGFTVRRNSDEDTYVYVNIITTTTGSGTCVTRYDAFLYTHATAKLSYTERPVLVQVSLSHRGGIGTSAPSGHASAVTRGLENYVDTFMTQIRDAGK